MTGEIRFSGRLVQSGGWVCLEVPREVSVQLGGRGRLPIVGTINGFPVSTSIFPTGDGAHMMLVNKEMQKGAGVKAGDSVKVVLATDTLPRTVTVPPDLLAALSKVEEARVAFEKLSYTHKKEYVSWIEEAKRPETRVKWIEQTVARLSGKQ